MIGVYATAWEVIEYLGDQDAGSFSVTDERFLRFTIAMSRKFDTHCRRVFLPRRETQEYDHPSPENISLTLSDPVSNSAPNTLILDGDLLQVLSLTTKQGAITLTSSEYYLRQGFTYNKQPYDRIELIIGETQDVFEFDTTKQKANVLDGIFGYNKDYSQAWQTIDSIQTDINSTISTIEVEDADASDELGLSPRIQRQQILRLGDLETSEYVYVQDVNYTNDNLTVTRAVNGTTALVTTSSGTNINVWRPLDDIKHALLVLSAQAYRRKESIGHGGDQTIAASGILIFPQRLPQEVKDMLSEYRKEDTPI